MNIIRKNEIDWGNPNLDLDKIIGIQCIDNEFGETNFGDLESKCDGICSNCMSTIIDDNKTRLSSILCCKSHPETGEVSSETGVCPNYDMDTGECEVYNTDDYSAACKNYHCKSHNK